MKKMTTPTPTQAFELSVGGLFTFMILFALFARPKAVAGDRVPKAPHNETAIDSIIEVEHWNGHSEGEAGERGPCQFRRATWAQYSNKPFFWADAKTIEQKIELRRVARAHIVWIRARIHEFGLRDNIYTIALIWNAGFNTVLTGKANYEQINYANRVKNVYDEIAP